MRFIVRAAPLTVTPALSDWPLTRRAADALSGVASQLLPAPRMPYSRAEPSVAPFGRGVVLRGSQETRSGVSDTATLVADSGGVLGVAVARGEESSVLLHAVLEEELLPLAQALSQVLAEAEAYGRAAVDLWLVLPRQGGVGGAVTADPPHEMHVSRELTTPADADEIRALAESWHRELERTVGVVRYEGEPRLEPREG